MFKQNRILLFLVCVITACGEPAQEQTPHGPLAFESSDECHVCGMVITRFPGPKGQAYDNRDKQSKKFCSTVALMSWYLQPENQSNVAEIYVHDMAETRWDSPIDTRLISAREAYFVIGSSKKGSMGKTIASFATRQQAQEFSKKWQGNLITFDEISLALINNSR